MITDDKRLIRGLSVGSNVVEGQRHASYQSSMKTVSLGWYLATVRLNQQLSWDIGLKWGKLMICATKPLVYQLSQENINDLCQ